jgi:coenzyme F420-0:L-glutamate ligase/coenzyme F420-1:gamma-L-glutamate ligase
MQSSNHKVVRPCDLLIKPLHGMPRVAKGDNVAELALAALGRADVSLQDGDVLVFAQKIISKAEDRSIRLDEVTPSERARQLARETGKDARIVELVLRESTEILRQRFGVIVVVHRLGMVLANAGVDQSNVDQGHALLLPVDPDASAAKIRKDVRAATGADVAVLIIDSIGRAWRLGTVGTAIGASGIATMLDLRGRPDLNGRRLESTEIGYADELAAAASLVMGQADEGVPAVLIRGAPYTRRDGSAADLLRPKAMDMFR